MEKGAEHLLRYGQAMAVELPPGMRLRAVDPDGGQLGAIMAFGGTDPRRVLSLDESLARALPARPADADKVTGLLEGDLVLSATGDELMRITADTMAAKGIHNAHALQCSRGAYNRAGGTDHDWCQEALMEALDPWDVEAAAARDGIYLDALDLFAKAQDYSPADDELPDGMTDDGNWEELGLPLSAPGDYIEFEMLMPCLVAVSNCARSYESTMVIEFYV